jgi:hypothetical protein
LEESVNESDQTSACKLGSIHHEKPEVCGDQLVAAAAGVQLPAERPEFLDERSLYEMVDIFGTRAELLEPGVVAFRFQPNASESIKGLRGLFLRENARGRQRFSPSTIYLNLVKQEPIVKRKGALERVELFVGFAVEAAAPEAVVFALGLCSH